MIAFTYVITLEEAITLWMVVIIVSILGVMAVVNYVGAKCKAVRDWFLKRKVARIEKRLTKEGQAK